MASCEGGLQGPQRGRTAPDAIARNTCGEATCQETTLDLIISKHADPNPEKPKLFCSVEQSQPGALEVKAHGVEQKAETQAEALEHVPTEAHLADQGLAEVDQVPENLVETQGKVEIGERSKKVTFLLEPDVSEATLTESVAPLGSSPRGSGEKDLRVVAEDAPSAPSAPTGAPTQPTPDIFTRWRSVSHVFVVESHLYLFCFWAQKYRVFTTRRILQTLSTRCLQRSWNMWSGWRKGRTIRTAALVLR